VKSSWSHYRNLSTSGSKAYHAKEKAVTQKHKSWMGNARAPTALFQSVHGSESV